MGGKRADHQEMAKDLLRRGIWHGKRLTKGITNIPSKFSGSAAMRRRTFGTPEYNRQKDRNKDRRQNRKPISKKDNEE